jgi:hypothetical protein
MKKKLLALTIALVLLFVAAIPAFAAGPNFGPAIYADGVAWGTKGNPALPAPTANNRQSFDGLYKLVDNEGNLLQLPVAEAAPGNPAYNGGRWIEYFVTWNEGYTPPSEPITSFEELDGYIQSGAVSVEESGNYFQCPLLPVK